MRFGGHVMLSPYFHPGRDDRDGCFKVSRINEMIFGGFLPEVPIRPWQGLFFLEILLIN